MSKHWRIALFMVTAPLAACSNPENDSEPAAAEPAVVDSQAIREASPESWLSYGRTYDEQRYSPLDQVNADNVRELGLAWYADLDTARGQEATPLVIDGNIYTSTAWSKVKAYDGASGELLWSFDPEVPGKTAVKACCDVVNRGLAAWGERLFLGTLDGRLIALDRASGEQLWSEVTVDQSQAYTITGAPRVVNGKVIIGNGGAEFGVRGYVSAYDAEDGKLLWRFYTVPGEPGSNDADYLRAAEKTWTGEWWEFGGGGTVWDSMAYDPELDLLYIGVGNGSPWSQEIRSPEGGDNLYLSSIVALRPDTGEYVWHYQTTPGDVWDYTATQHIMLADLEIDGETRKVLMQAPKNGFFYVLDRETGELISANNYAPVTWATGIDEQTGRPSVVPEARWDKASAPTLVAPGPGGAHNWQPMAFQPDAGLVYIPVSYTAFPYFAEADWEKKPLGFNTGADFATIAMPADPEFRKQAMAGTTGALLAWDPVEQEERWRVPFQGPWNGGVLATAGGLVFQGHAPDSFAAYDAATGEELWSTNAQTGVIAAPMTYSIDGEQYVAVLAGWGGIHPLVTGVLAEVGGPVRNVSRLLVYKLGGSAELPPYEDEFIAPLNPPPVTGTEEQLALGARHYGRFCAVCHGDAAYGGSLLPDLRRSGLLTDADAWETVTLAGSLEDRGMVGFAEVLTPAEAEAIRYYVIKRANEDKALEEGGQ
jgi:quinohemoprotein ethanol dehydrogenase